MATGTGGGLLATPKATSIFKHEILKQYSTVFLAKVASRSTGGRVMVLDGFAGRGRFVDGTPGSAELFMSAAVGLAPRTVASIRLFEKNRDDAERLADVVAEYRAMGLDVTSECADVETRLSAAIKEADGIPLFLFLDPCGQNLPFDTVVGALSGDRGKRWPPTEALLNLSADFTRRVSGVLHAGQQSAGLETMDQVMGGSWWRKIALDAHAATPDGTWGVAADKVASECTHRLARAANTGGVVIPVRRKPENQPTYHLVYLTRSNDGHWVMADALARARQKWLREVGPQPDDEQGPLFDFDIVGEKIEEEQTTAAERARTRILRLAADHRKFVLVDHVIEVYGPDYGVMTESTLGKVLKGLVSEKRLVREPGYPLGKAPFTFAG
ncbi:three-Cys-motif partner protein TcmP [Nocardioides sp. KR10-350]|uniref:three-Cys-motif partner protein TcmP n=1 Tax=Nocardioides cheoyonin TaxID=3156615 RepID=UPI0032B3A9B2